jgi:hypothetical protein
MYWLQLFTGFAVATEQSVLFWTANHSRVACLHQWRSWRQSSYVHSPAIPDSSGSGQGTVGLFEHGAHPPATHCFIARLIFQLKDGGDAFLWNVCSHDYISHQMATSITAAVRTSNSKYNHCTSLEANNSSAIPEITRTLRRKNIHNRAQKSLALIFILSHSEHSPH